MVKIGNPEATLEAVRRLSENAVRRPLPLTPRLPANVVQLADLVAAAKAREQRRRLEQTRLEAMWNI